MTTLKLEQIRINGGTQYRDQIDQSVVQEYAELMREGIVFTPVKVMFDGSHYWLVDGFHRYFSCQAANLPMILCDVQNGTQELAQFRAMAVNREHGLKRNNATKTKVVQAALIHPMSCEMSDTEMARHCGVSTPFVGAIRRPEVKAKQSENIEKHYKKKFSDSEDGFETKEDRNSITKVKENNEDSDQNRNSITKVKEVPDFVPPVTDGNAPSKSEMDAMELAHQADVEAMQRLVDSSEPLKEAHDEIKKLNFTNAQLNVRIKGLMNEKNEAIAMALMLRKQLDKANKK